MRPACHAFILFHLFLFIGTNAASMKTQASQRAWRCRVQWSEQGAQIRAHLWSNIVRSATKGARGHVAHYPVFAHPEIGNFDVAVCV